MGDVLSPKCPAAPSSELALSLCGGTAPRISFCPGCYLHHSLGSWNRHSWCCQNWSGVGPQTRLPLPWAVPLLPALS